MVAIASSGLPALPWSVKFSEPKNVLYNPRKFDRKLGGTGGANGRRLLEDRGSWARILRAGAVRPLTMVAQPVLGRLEFAQENRGTEK